MTENQNAKPLLEVRQSLEQLIHDPKVPAAVRSALEPEYQQLATMLDKLEKEHVHIAVFGRVSVGKSSLLNALIGEPRFAVSALHGKTVEAEMSGPVSKTAATQGGGLTTEDGTPETAADGQVFFIDTPGIDEIDGETREQQARDVAARADLLLFVVEADPTAVELTALRGLLAAGRPLLVVLNKADRYTRDEQQKLLAELREHCNRELKGMVADKNIVLTSASPAERLYVTVNDNGAEVEEMRQPPPQITELRDRLWSILETEGKSLCALNAGLFAGQVSDEVARRIVAIKSDVATSIINRYCLAKGVAVALNPVPLADLAAAAALDVTMVYHLSRVYGLPLTRSEAGGLVRVIFAQLALLMGTVWVMHLASSALKTLSAGLSTAITAAGQGAVAWYATYVVGAAARRYLENGASWGNEGPKRAVQQILDSIDRDSVLGEARAELKGLLKKQKKARG